LTEARDAAEAAVRARAQFLAAMSHEIRTPLNGILGVNEILATTAMTDMQRDYVKIIQQSGTHLLGMLSEILDYSKIEQQGVDLELIPFDPAAVLREVSAMLAPAAASHDLVLEVQAADGLPRQLVGDPVRVRQVLLNLVGNAIKFTPSGRIDVSLTGAHVTNGQWRVDFAVRDTGIGIAPEALGKLFLEFSQTDGSISRRFGGTGLGLAISRRIIEAMAGSICVDSTPGKGSTFSFYILADAVTEIAMDATVADKPIDIAALVAAQCPVVLLAEDNQVNRFVATRLLERIGCKVVLAENGREAVEAVRNNVINLVLMDVMMPEMDGLAATRAIRALVPPLNAIPIIGLSANAFRSDAEDGRAAGMNDFLTKPIDSARLLAAIGAVCQGAAKPPQPRPARLTPLQQMRDELGDETVDAVIEAFQTDVPKMLTRLRTQAEAGTAAGVAREAHALAGTAGSLGLAELSEAAREVEREARRTAAVPGTSTLEALENRFLSAADAMTEDMAF
jgi:CheY-like chemotaxis protein/HPt (histidine-containing phosphotransfer) domain-containing protein